MFFTRFGKLEGLVTKSDMTALMTQHVPFAGTLERKVDEQADDPRNDVIWEAR